MVCFLSLMATTVSLLTKSSLCWGGKDRAKRAQYWQECPLAGVSVHDQAWDYKLRPRLKGLLAGMNRQSQGQRSCSSYRTGRGRRRTVIFYMRLFCFSFYVGKLRSFNLDKSLLKVFYTSFIESVVTFAMILVWKTETCWETLLMFVVMSLV